MPQMPASMVEPPSKRHGSGRQRERRAAEEAVRCHTAQRVPPSPEQLAALFHAIESGNLSGFGLRLLAGLQLDDLHPPPASLRWEPGITLVAFAAWRRRARFVRALLRAGADPSVRAATARGGTPLDAPPAGPAAEGASPAELLAGLPASYAVWLLCALARMRLAGRLARDAASPGAICCVGGCGLEFPVGWPCGHLACERCLWAAVARSASRGEQLACPTYGQSVPDDVADAVEAAPRHRGRVPSHEGSGPEGDWSCAACHYENFAYRATCRCCSTPEGGAFTLTAAELAPPRPPPPKLSLALASTMATVSDAAEALLGRWGACAASLSCVIRAAGAVAGGGALLWVSRGSGGRRVVVATGITAAAAALMLRWHVVSRQGRRQAAAAARCAASRAAWLALPEDSKEDGEDGEGEEGGKSRRPRGERFRPLPLPQAAATFLGTTRAKRSAELLAAGGAGNLPRLRALLEAGVDVDAVNEVRRASCALRTALEVSSTTTALLTSGRAGVRLRQGGRCSHSYGQSALFLAAQASHVSAVQLLASYGANADLPAHGGSRPATAATDEKTLAALAAAGADLRLPGSHGLSARQQAARRSSGGGGAALFGPRRTGTLTVLIPRGEAHPGAGSFMVDGAFSEEWLAAVAALWARLPVADKKGSSGSDAIIHRSYFCDAERWVGDAVEAALVGTGCAVAHPCVRFLHYYRPGGRLPPHVDLPKADAAGVRSTHTLLVYLEGPPVGGETVLMDNLNAPSRQLPVAPRRGRMLIFPHDCPHKAEPIGQAPKLVLRGEVH
eukprot:jgi/Tetstr1/424570/TSEL_015095.t1